MKRLILSATVMLLLAGGVQAQTSERTATKQTTTAHQAKAKKGTKAKKAGATKAKGVKVTSEQLNDRRMYKAQNGQRATPTGHEATPIGGGYASLKKDTTVVPPKEATKPKRENEEQ